YSQVLVSRGDLHNVSSPAAATAAGVVNFTWTNNEGLGKAKANDRAILVAYCPELNLSVYTTGSALRSVGADTLHVIEFAGKVVETYIGFISEDSRDLS